MVRPGHGDVRTIFLVIIVTQWEIEVLVHLDALRQIVRSLEGIERIPAISKLILTNTPRRHIEGYSRQINIAQRARTIRCWRKYRTSLNGLYIATLSESISFTIFQRTWQYDVSKIRTISKSIGIDTNKTFVQLYLLQTLTILETRIVNHTQSTWTNDRVYRFAPWESTSTNINQTFSEGYFLQIFIATKSTIVNILNRSRNVYLPQISPIKWVIIYQR